MGEPNREHENPFEAPKSGAESFKVPPVRSPAIDQNARTLGMLTHLLGLLTSFVGPLIIWLVKKDEHPFVEDQAKEALNFQILLVICYTVSSVLTTVCIGFLLLPVVVVLHIVFCVMGMIEANKGEYFRYPLNLRIIK